MKLKSRHVAHGDGMDAGGRATQEQLPDARADGDNAP